MFVECLGVVCVNGWWVNVFSVGFVLWWDYGVDFSSFGVNFSGRFGYVDFELFGVEMGCGNVF